jgi:uncharacterized membrane protein YgcG
MARLRLHKRGVVMKKLFVLLVFVLTARSAAPAQESADFGLFYSSLGQHGEWISVDGGTYAWRPSGVASDWRPYYNGRWVWTDEGWYWASDEPWGWAAYHYGRWYRDDYYGWCWIPGYDWAPAWVEWRYGGTCVGWAPLGPYAVFSMSWGIHYRRYWSTPASYWSFIDCAHIGMNHVNRYVYRTDENSRFIGRTRTAGSVRYDNGRIVTRGPAREFVEARGNIRVNRADMVDVRERGQVGIVREGDREKASVYRPRIEENGRDAARRPERVSGEGRTIGIDTKGTDVRRREMDREAGRDIRRADEMRQQRNVERSRVDENRTQERSRTDALRGREEGRVLPDARSRREQQRPNIDRSAPRNEGRIERQAERPRDWARPSRPSPGVREAPRMGAERGSSRGSGGGTRSESPRGGGSRGGGERGGRR